MRRNYGENAEKLLMLIIQNNYITTSEIASELNVSQSTIEKTIKKLKKAEYLIRIGPDRGGYWKVISDKM